MTVRATPGGARSTTDRSADDTDTLIIKFQRFGLVGPSAPKLDYPGLVEDLTFRCNA